VSAVREGERFFGYCPMATEMLLTPRAAPFGVVDVATHLDARAFAAPPALDHGPQPEPVSANALLRKRVRATGQDRLDADIARAWARYVPWCDGWLKVRRAGGPDAVRAAFLDVLGGRVAPTRHTS